MNPLISVIIPVYNVENYLNDCLDSVLSQTYKNLEIILVDDGSSDKCPCICDEYAKKDSRIRVIHKENEGVSVARNLGLDVARGDYIGFVDGDDFISKDFYRALYDNITKHSADISACLYCNVYENIIAKILHDRTLLKSDYVIANRVEALRLFFENKINTSSWNRLYRREIIESIRFPIDVKLGEDVVFTYRTFDNSNAIVFSNNYHYYYRQRKSGAFDSRRNRYHQRLFEILLNDADYYKTKYPSLSELIECFILRVYISILSNYIDHLCVETYPEISNYVKIIRKHLCVILKSNSIEKKKKLLALTIFINKNLYRAIKQLSLKYRDAKFSYFD